MAIGTLAAAFIASPLFAHASVLSFVSSLFTSQQSDAQTVLDSTTNSQQIPLLQAAVNTNPTPVAVSDTTTLISGNSLQTSAGPSGTAADIGTTTDATSDQITVYTVHDGDTIASVAKLFNVTSNTILWANDLKAGSSIKKDDILVILPVSGVRYTVKKGDTLQTIAKAEKGDVDEIAQYNNLADNAKLAIGDTLIIPDGEAPTVVSAPASKPVKKPSSSSTVTKPATSSSSSSSGDHKTDPNGYFKFPLASGIRTQGLHGHNGVDWANVLGTPIMAAAGGKVIIARSGGWNGGYGTYVVISHANGMQTLYAHMSALEVSVGDQVSQGQTIGLMGETGEATGVHLHFEVRGGTNPF